ncbi:hypothetical protein [Ferrovibrio sp.]|uniref:hypothetical protein n=1 Tax=Ferrovibrio sp. TaxID=1917215 RepID=UPI003D2B0026
MDLKELLLQISGWLMLLALLAMVFGPLILAIRRKNRNSILVEVYNSFLSWIFGPFLVDSWAEKRKAKSRKTEEPPNPKK